MHNSDQDKQDQRMNIDMEDSASMTIEFLRARLLSERSVSRTARQRADELAKRVVDLEEQLKIVSFQRKKAEKATSDLLAILEDHGVTDVSEAFDSNSDQEVSPYGSEVGNNVMKQEKTSVNSKARKNYEDELSGSEESSPLPGRSLSWKSGKDTPHSVEKKYMNSSRRRSSFSSIASSSPKHRSGKSCRQIRRREARSTMEELRNGNIVPDTQSNAVAPSSEELRNCSESGLELLGEGSEIAEEKVTNAGQYLNGHGGYKDMERALEHQSQLIGRYEEEEKAQRDWEEKFRENNSSTPDSCEPGNQSDITEERDEIKVRAAAPIASEDQNAKSGAIEVSFTDELSKVLPTTFQLPSYACIGSTPDQRGSSAPAYESPATDCMAKEKQAQEQFENYSHHPPSHNHHCSGPYDSYKNQSSANISSTHAGSSSVCMGETSECQNESYAIVPHKPPSDFGEVLEALQQAKSSLQQELSRLQLVESGSVGKAIEASIPATKVESRVEIPVGCAGLFRVPSDFQIEATAKTNFLDSSSRLSLANTYPEKGIVPTAGGRFDFVPSPYLETRSNVLSSDQFMSSPYMETRSSVLNRGRFMSSPYMETRLNTSSNDRFLSSPCTETTHGARIPDQKPFPPPSSSYTYPTYPSFPDIKPRMPSNEGFQRSSLPSEVNGMPSPEHFSFYYDRSRPNMYR